MKRLTNEELSRVVGPDHDTQTALERVLAEECLEARKRGEINPDLKEAQELYFSLGGMPSQSMTPRKAPWYWRRAAKIMRDQREAVLHHLRATVARIDKATFAHGDTIGEHSDEFNKARLDICEAIDAAGGRGTR